MNIIETLQMLSSNIWIYGGTFILVLSILVFVHEWGHYIVARMNGVKVEVFSIGFGKELFGFNDKSGTRWKVCLIPLGGYVKLFGDVDPASVKHADGVETRTGEIRPFTEAERKAAFFAKPVWRRASIVFAGPAINYIFAIILLAGLFMFSGQPVTPPVGAAVMGGSSADKYAFQPHDRVLTIDGRKITDFEDIRREMAISLNKEKRFEVERGGKIIFIDAVPEKMEIEDRFGFKHSRGMLGLISPRHAIDIANIRKIDGKAYSDVESVRSALLRKMGTTFKVEVQAGPETNDVLTVRPMAEFNAALKSDDLADKKRNVLFLANLNPENALIKYSPLNAIGQAFKQAWIITDGTLEALGQMVTGTRSAAELGGVIRIGALAGDMAQQGIVAIILFMALLSINLGLINLFPIPILDGGHLVFYTFEALLGKPVPERVQEYAFRFGLVFLVSVMVYANLSDIVQLIL